MRRRRALLAALAVQVALLAWVSAPRLSPRLNGDEYHVLVRAVDPVDPFRGRYVDLDYRIAIHPQEAEGRVWVPLERRRNGRWRLGEAVGERPDGPVLRCEADDAAVDCGIDSFFASEDRARARSGAARPRSDRTAEDRRRRARRDRRARPALAGARERQRLLRNVDHDVLGLGEPRRVARLLEALEDDGAALAARLVLAALLLGLDPARHPGVMLGQPNRLWVVAQ